MSSTIEAKKDHILYWMMEYIRDSDNPPYKDYDVHECGAILDNFIELVSGSSSNSDFEWVTSKVQELVLTLNRFNEKHDHSIIETDQREGICKLVGMVIAEAGHQVDEDITEEWREW